MATLNAASSTNTINWVEYSYSTKLDFFTDRATTVTSLSPHDRIQSVENLGVGVTATNPFTLLG